MTKKPIISVVTICYNAEEYIEATVKSVLQQTYSNIEYIVVDGNSKDNTLIIVNQYKEKIKKIISEPDKGIYDAMNKGIDLCSGDWCLFLNSGDYFYAKDTIQKAVELFNDNADVIYGDTEYRFDYGNDVLKPKELEKVMDGAFCCHQSTFFKLDTLRKYKYDLSYKIIADWVLYRKMYLDGKVFYYIPTIISSFDNINGASTANSVQSFVNHKKEKARCKGNNGNVLGIVWIYCRAFAFIMRRTINKLMPRSVYYKLKRIWIHLHQ